MIGQRTLALAVLGGSIAHVTAWALIAREPKSSRRFETPSSEEERERTAPDRIRDLEQRLEAALERAALSEKARMEREASAPEPENSESVQAEEAAVLVDPSRYGDVSRRTTVRAFEERMSSEARDAAWAGNYEQRIEAETREHFPSVRVVGNRCKSTVCEVRVEADDEASLQTLVDEFPQHYPTFGQAHYEHTTGAAGERGITLHLVRPEAAPDFASQVATELEVALSDVAP
jgi:hypothetical protein